jgi:hypothetical protein
MRSINTDSSRNSSSILNPESLRRTNIYHDDETNISVIYPSPSIDAYEKKLFELLSNCDKVEWKPEWYMRPDYVSKQFYGTEMYWSLILYINNISSIEDFNCNDYILVPSLPSLSDLLRERYDPNDIVNVTPTTSDVNPEAKLYKKYPLDNDELNKKSADARVNNFEVSPETPPIYDPPSLLRLTETYTLTADHISGAYVSLSYIPVNVSTISFKLSDLTYNQKYAYDYILTIDDEYKHKKISWKATDCPYGSGLEAILDEVGMVIEITYIYDENAQDQEVPTQTIDGGVFTAVDLFW